MLNTLAKAHYAFLLVVLFGVVMAVLGASAFGLVENHYTYTPPAEGEKDKSEALQGLKVGFWVSFALMALAAASCIAMYKPCESYGTNISLGKEIMTSAQASMQQMLPKTA